MTTGRHHWLAVFLAAPLACSTLSAQEQPAVITASTPSSRAELLSVITAAFNGQPVMLADDALTRDSLLTVERREPPALVGRAGTGRALEMPEQFRLLLRNSKCILVRQSDGREWELRDTQCAPLTTSGAR